MSENALVAFALLAMVYLLLFTWPEQRRGTPFPRRGKEQHPKHPYRRPPRQ
jgi:hypothetical protein